MLILAVGLTTSVALTACVFALTIVAVVTEGPKPATVAKAVTTVPAQKAVNKVKRKAEKQKGFNFSDSICLTC